MDFDLSKENIQPLRKGRNVHQLEIALQAQTDPEIQQQLQQQKDYFERLIQTYKGEDPLQNYYDYIGWIEQTYPKNGHEGNCVGLLEHCLAKFEDDPRYTNDNRLCKLWIKYIDTFPNPVELYLMMKSKNLCVGLAEFYRAWAYYYEAAGDFQKACNVFEEGKKNLAQPYDELELAYKNLVTAAGEHMLFGPNEDRLNEKRHALTSLHSYRSGAVGSVRLPSANNGFVAVSMRGNNENLHSQLRIHQDPTAASLAGGAAPRSIITAAKRQEAPKENTMKPGPWTTFPHKKRVLSSKKPAGAAFVVLEDDIDECQMNKCLPADLPPHDLEDFSDWHVSLVNHPDPETSSVVYGYPKRLVYSEPDVEYSLEELRSLNYRKPAPVNPTFQMVVTPQAQAPFTIPEDEDEECIIVMQDAPPMETADHDDVGYAVSPHQRPHSDSESFRKETTSTISHSPWKSTAEHQNFLQNVFSKSNEDRLSCALPSGPLQIYEDSQPNADSPFHLSFNSDGKCSPAFAPYEQSFNESMRTRAPPKGNAMKTAFRQLNADEVETGSRGGMDGAMAAQPADGARAIALLSSPENSSSSYGEAAEEDAVFDADTHQFNFNLNAMKVSTPQTKNQVLMVNELDRQNSCKTLFRDDNALSEKQLSTIVEEKSGFVSSSGSSGATTKSSFFTKHNKINTISEEHNSYLEQNMRANEELRRSLLGHLMEDVLPSHCVSTESAPPATLMSPVESPVKKMMTSPNRTQPISYVPSDPFDANLINKLLDRVSFPGRHSRGYVAIDGNPRLSVKKDPVYIGRDSYVIEKLLGKGQFGTVYKAYSYQMSCTVALKYQKPPNRWEYYICRELQARLANHPLHDRFMDVSVGYFSEQASILISQYQPYGTLLDTANLIKPMGGKAKENLCLFFTVRMMEIVRAMHQVKIIHADIKPDNFLVLILPDNSIGLQLIDFGCSIDMTLFPDGATFSRPITTENFVCCEVLDKRRWNYHTDLFCVAASSYVLLFQEYAQLRRMRDGTWSIVARMPRFVKQELWTGLFHSMLNQQRDCADLATLEMLFREELDEPQRQKELPHQLNSLKNALKNR